MGVVIQVMSDSSGLSYLLAANAVAADDRTIFLAFVKQCVRELHGTRWPVRARMDWSVTV